MYVSVALNVPTTLFNHHHHHLIPESFHHLNGKLYPLRVFLKSCFPPASKKINLISIPVHVDTLFCLSICFCSKDTWVVSAF